MKRNEESFAERGSVGERVYEQVPQGARVRIRGAMKGMISEGIVSEPLHHKGQLSVQMNGSAVPEHFPSAGEIHELYLVTPEQWKLERGTEATERPEEGSQLFVAEVYQPEYPSVLVSKIWIEVLKK